MQRTPMTVPIAQLAHYYDNPRQGDIGAISESLRVLGQYRTIVVNRGTHTGRPWEVLAGNHTTAAARSLGWETLDVEVVDVDETTARKIVVYDNHTNDLATNDEEALLRHLEALEAEGALDPGVVSGDDIDALRALMAGPASLDDLGAEYGDFSDDDMLRTLTMKVPRPLFDQWAEHRRGHDTDAEALEALLDR